MVDEEWRVIIKGDIQDQEKDKLYNIINII